MKIGDKYRGTITGIKPYGAFVALENGKIGLIHISELKTGYIENIHALVAVGDQVYVQVIDYDEYNRKASLSLRSLEEEKHHVGSHHRFSNNRYTFGFEPLAKQLPDWINQALKDLKGS
ncbi:S1 RNA-binding domain-containing protein [Streptococcus halichoeri]|uniref:S1 RNA-binding domain-containing protein n=1 Tax=Streptococcus halichoeri TaxID=254785 RepID=UPI0013593409|nr:S1 RNA-binding domain-containing protein [Streptococcus halichoeri]